MHQVDFVVAVAISEGEQFLTEVFCNKFTDINVVSLLAEVFSRFHEVFNLVVRFKRVFYYISFMFLIKLKHFEDEFADSQLEFLLNSFRQMRANVILEINLARIGLFDPSMILKILEEQYFPEFRRHKVNVLE